MKTGFTASLVKILGALLVALIVIALCGCATIMHGSMQSVNFKSTPSDAQVKVYDSENIEVQSGTTPCSLKLDRGAGFFKKARYKIEISKPGYATKELYVSGQMGVGWYLIGNLFSWDLLGYVVIDPASGAMWSLPKEVEAALDAGTSMQESGPTIALVDEIPASEMEHAKYLGQLISAF